MAWVGYLSRDQLKEVRVTLIAADLFQPQVFAAILGVLPNYYRALLPHNTNIPDAMRIDQTLGAMNSVVNLKGGEVPLKLVLSQAADYAADEAHRRLIEDMIEVIDNNRPTPGLPAAAAAAVVLPAAGPPAGETARDRLRAQLPDPRDAEITPEAKIGDFDETISVDFLERGLAVATSVFKIVVHRHFDGQPNFNAGDVADLSSGTAWVLRPGIGITNFHVFNARTDAEGNAAPDDFAKQAATARLIEDYRAEEDDREGHLLGGAALLYADQTLDFALFRLPAALADRPALTLRRHPIRKTEVQRIGDRVNVLQHPMGRPMRLGFRNNFVVLGNNDILAYLTDTNRGSSGAPVLDDSWAVAALHVGSQAISVPDIKLMGVEIRRENFGVPVKTILAHVEAKAPDVFAEIGG